MAKKTVTIVTPVHNEAENLATYRQTVSDVLLGHEKYDINVLLVDDGSSDNSWEIIQQICAEDKRFNALRLARNLGAHIAIACGVDHVRSDAIAILACDLQDPAKVVLEFIDAWEKGAQVVWGVRRSREDDNWRILTSKLFFYLLKKFAMPRESLFTTGSFILFDRRVAEYLRSCREHSRITFALVGHMGFRQKRVEYDRQKRQAGTSGWNFARMITALYDAFIGFSVLPVKAISVVGMLMAGINVMLIAYFILNWLFFDTFEGWTSIAVMMTTLFTILFVMMAIISEYLTRIYRESLHRPLYFVSDETGPAIHTHEEQ